MIAAAALAVAAFVCDFLRTTGQADPYGIPAQCKVLDKHHNIGDRATITAAAAMRDVRTPFRLPLPLPDSLQSRHQVFNFHTR